MPVSSTPAIERIARVLAGHKLSQNAEGTEEHASNSVEMEWGDWIDSAIAVLKTLREPDAGMAAAGDVEVWERMVAAAIGQHSKAGSADLPEAPLSGPALGGS
ncbi:MAG TPA: hypothetical protein VF463_15865 [Sphingobium sp.]